MTRNLQSPLALGEDCIQHVKRRSEVDCEEIMLFDFVLTSKSLGRLWARFTDL